MTAHDILKNDDIAYLHEDDGGIVLASNILIRRNFADFLFPHKSSPEARCAVNQRLRELLPKLTAICGQKFYQPLFTELSPAEKDLLVDKSFVTIDFIDGERNQELFITPDTTISLMTNGYDHLITRHSSSGINLEELLPAAWKIDDCIEEKFDFAFTENLGYLSAYPLHAGTGLYASVILHLPCLCLTQQLDKIKNIAAQLGLALHKVFGDDASDYLFVLNNQLSPSANEIETIDNLTRLAKKIVSMEQSARQMIFSYSRDKITDRLWRAYGILQYARNLHYREAQGFLSDIRLGISEKILPVPAVLYRRALISIQDSYLRTQFSDITKENDSEELNIKRAEMLRKIFAQ